MMNPSRQILLLSLLVLLVSLIACSDKSEAESSKSLVIYHHGSPTPAIVAAEEAFRALYPEIEVRREKGDALPNMRKVTDQGKFADIVYTDDYSIIPPVMFPKFADSWIRYAHDEMTIAYAENSKFADEVNAGNWFEILKRPGVRWGIADPNAGPDGYFSVGQVLLSNLHYKQPGIFHDLIEANTSIRAHEQDGRYVIDCPSNLEPNNSKVIIRPDPESLYPMILAGEIDYAFGYMGSVVGEGPAGIKTIDLPREVDLSEFSLVAGLYNRVTINMFSDKPDQKLEVRLGAKANGLTIPKNAPNPEAAAAYLAIFLGKVGQDALNSVHITALVPAETNDLSKAPKVLQSMLTEAK